MLTNNSTLSSSSVKNSLNTEVRLSVLPSGMDLTHGQHMKSLFSHP